MNFLKSLWQRIRRGTSAAFSYGKRHKVQAVIALLVVIGLCWWGYSAYAKSATTAQYSLATAADGAIAVTVTSSGEVSAQHTLTLSPKASGTLESVTVKPGDKVVAGQIIATVDSTDAQKTLRDAQISLESAKISYQSSLASANSSMTNTQDSVTSARDAGFDAVANVQADLPTTLTDMKSLVEGNTLTEYANLVDSVDPGIDDAAAQAKASFDAALTAQDRSDAAFQAASRSSSPEDIATLLNDTYENTITVSQAAKDILAFLNRVNTDIVEHNALEAPADLATSITSFTSYSSKANSDVSSLRSAQTSLASAQQDLANANQSVSGGTPLDIETAQLNMQKAQNAYTDALASLDDYNVRAPFAGTIATVALQKFDQSGNVATLITDETYADLSMNETDASKVQAGQPVDLTFDAIDNFDVKGTVAEVSGLGTVSQGVTTYDVKVSLDSDDTRIKPGMTVEATITTASKDSALLIPVSALKSTTVNGTTSYYVQVATASSTGAIPAFGGNRASSTASTTRRAGGRSGAASTTPNGMGSTSSSTGTFPAGMVMTRTTTVDADKVTVTRVPVTIGLENDTEVEITSGLTMGQQVVSQSLNASGKSTQSSGIFGLFGGGARTGAATAPGAAAGAVRPATGAAGATRSFTGGAAAGGAARGGGFTGGGRGG